MQVYLRKDNIIAYIQNYAKMRLESMYNFQLDFLLAILGFMPREGDWLDIEYSVEQGSIQGDKQRWLWGPTHLCSIPSRWSDFE